MGLTNLLKQVIEALPGDQFTQAWKCIEEIDAALNKAGPTALLAMKYCQEVHEERMVQLLDFQQNRINVLSTRLETREEVANDLGTALTKAERKIKRLQKKTSKK